MRLLRACFLMVGLSLLAVARAGGGPETTLLVVNADSPLSLAVANEYIRLRELPERQVLWLSGVPVSETINVEDFRTRILAPIRSHLEAQGLEQEVDLIAYSAGFPYAVNFVSDERAHGLERDRHRAEAGSLTGMTFFMRDIEARRVGYLGLRANLYFRYPLRRTGAPSPVADAGSTTQTQGGQQDVTFEATRGFRSRYEWAWERSPGRVSTASSGRYVLSVMLGYAGVRGNSLPEIAAYLERAAGSDGTHPKGTVYLMENRDVRSRTRQPLFAPTGAALAARGRGVEVLAAGRDGQNGREPKGRDDVIGLVAGTRSFDWPGSGSTMLPGAIAESLTSYAGHFTNGSQTKLTEFLRHGAAGSSGAVREPYSFVEKFPVPYLHVHYADGASLAEAYYQSVAGPYQLLIVGDPLARPFAHFAQVAVGFPSVDQPWRGVVEVVPQVESPAGRLVERVELWVNGELIGSAPSRQSIRLDTTALPDGMNELRLVAVEASRVETRSFMRTWMRVDNRGRSVEVHKEGGVDRGAIEVGREAGTEAGTESRTEGPRSVVYGAIVAFSGRADGAQRVRLQQGSRVLAEAEVRDGRWAMQFSSAVLGMGRASLQVVGVYPDEGLVRAKPLTLRVTDPPLIAADEVPNPDNEGVRLRLQRRVGDAFEEIVAPGVNGRPPRDFRAGRASHIGYAGAFEVRESGLYELSVEARGDVVLSVEGWGEHRARVDTADGGFRVALPLEKGWHRFSIDVSQATSDRVRAVLAGPEVAFELAGDRVRW